MNESNNPLIPLPKQIQETVDRMNIQSQPMTNPFILTDSHKPFQDNKRIALPTKPVKYEPQPDVPKHQ